MIDGKYYIVYIIGGIVSWKEMCRVAKEMRKEYRAKHEIIQIGVVLLDEGMKVTDRISIFVKPEYGWIDPFIERLTGISQEQVSHAPMLAEAMYA